MTCKKLICRVSFTHHTDSMVETRDMKRRREAGGDGKAPEDEQSQKEREETLQRELKAAQEAARQAEADLGSLQEQYLDRQREAAELSQKVQELQTELKSSSATHTMVQTELGNVTAELSDLERRYRELQQKYDTQTAARAPPHAASYMAAMRLTKGLIVSLKAQVASLKADVERVQVQNRQIQDLEAEIERLKIQDGDAGARGVMRTPVSAESFRQEVERFLTSDDLSDGDLLSFLAFLNTSDVEAPGGDDDELPAAAGK